MRSHKKSANMNKVRKSQQETDANTAGIKHLTGVCMWQRQRFPKSHIVVDWSRIEFPSNQPLQKSVANVKRGIIPQYLGVMLFTSETYSNYWHYIREGICREYKKEYF